MAKPNNRRGNGGRNNERPQQNDSKFEKIGALWLGESQRGVKYMSGVIQDSEGNDIRVVVFKNGFKEEDKHPDYVVYLSKERQQAASNGRGSAKTEPPSGGAQDEDAPF